MLLRIGIGLEKEEKIMTDNHTSTPWERYEEDVIAAGGGTDIARCWKYTGGPETKSHSEAIANATHIVRCVNAHNDLVAALTAILANLTVLTLLDGGTYRLGSSDGMTARQIVENARAALAKAQDLK